MARSKELSSETRQSILDLRNEGCSMRDIAKKLKVSYNAVYYTLHRTEQTGSNQNRERSGRPRCTTEQEDKYIRVTCLKNRRLTGPQLAASLNSTRKTAVSTSTVKRRLRDAGLLGRIAKKKPCLRPANKKKPEKEKTKTTETLVEGSSGESGPTNPSLGCPDVKEEHS